MEINLIPLDLSLSSSFSISLIKSKHSSSEHSKIAPMSFIFNGSPATNNKLSIIDFNDSFLETSVNSY
ncbi:hypothetical protein D3C81_1434210 [compost metagenome]